MTWIEVEDIPSDIDLNELVANAYGKEIAVFVPASIEQAGVTGMPAIGWASQFAVRGGVLFADVEATGDDLDRLIALTAQIEPHFHDSETGADQGATVLGLLAELLDNDANYVAAPPLPAETVPEIADF